MGSKYEDVVRCLAPIRQHIHRASLDALDQRLRLEPASLGTAASSGYRAAPGDGFEHALNVVVAVGGDLAGNRAQDAITH